VPGFVHIWPQIGLKQHNIFLECRWGKGKTQAVDPNTVTPCPNQTRSDKIPATNNLSVYNRHNAIMRRDKNNSQSDESVGRVPLMALATKWISTWNSWILHHFNIIKNTQATKLLNIIIKYTCLLKIIWQFERSCSLLFILNIWGELFV